MNNGFIVLHRKFIQWEWYTDQNTKAVMLHLILIANHKDSNWRGISLKRGQTIATVNRIATETGLTNQNVRTALKHLEQTNEITREVTRKVPKGATIITVINYGKYQDKDGFNNKQSNNQVTNEVTPQPTNNQQTTNKRLTTNNNDNNDNNDNKETNIGVCDEVQQSLFGEEVPTKSLEEIQQEWFNDFWSKYPKKTGKQTACDKFKSKCKTKSLFELIMQSLELQNNNNFKGMEKRFIPNPSTWLNQERWSDEIISKSQPTTKETWSFDDFSESDLEQHGDIFDVEYTEVN